MADFFAWDDSYAVGIPIVDDQHKELLKYGDRFSELIATGGVGLKSEELESEFQKFREYLTFHFRSEEKVMEEIKYNNLGAHRREHNAILEKVAAYNTEKIKSDPVFALTEIRSLLQSILYDHVMETDSVLGKAYRRYNKLFKHMEEAKRKIREENERKFGVLIKELDVAFCYLNWDQSQKGHCVIVSKEKTSNLVRLSTLEKNTLMAELYRVMLIVQKSFKPDDLQVVYAGDIDGQLAIHIIPKYKDMETFGQITPPKTDCEKLSDEEYKKIIDQFLENF